MLKSTVMSAVAQMKDAIEDLGIDAFVVERTADPYVPGQPQTYTTENRPIKLVLTKYKLKEIDNDRILAGDYQGIVFPEKSGTVLDLKVNDLIYDGQSYWRVMGEDRVMAGTSVALYVLQLRRTLL